MGHYSDLYEAEREESDRKNRDRYKEEIAKEIKKMTTDNLSLLRTISQNIESLHTVFKIIARK